MWLLDLTLPTPEENIALDEALLEEADSAAEPQEILRVWESPATAVVIGRSSRAREEVDFEFCSEHHIPVLRRCSGGAAVVVGPGCLIYSVVLSFSLRPQLHAIDEAHRLVLGQIAAALRDRRLDVVHQGISDLTWNGRKVSGNSLRCKRGALLYHGTLLYQFPLDLLAGCLRTAPRQPEYRGGRDHRDFVANLPVGARDLREAVLAAWPTDDGVLPKWPCARTRQLVAERYSLVDWNLRL